MTNANIILAESVKLMERGVIGDTGRTIVLDLGKGEKKTLPEPEPIHTFAGWKSYGRQVKKGEHARASFQIWKHKAGKKTIDEKTGEETEGKSKMFLTKAYFFVLDQTEPVKAKEA